MTKDTLRAAAGVVVHIMALILRFTMAWQTSPSESKVHSVDYQQHHHRPLAVLRVGSSKGDLEIYAEDPTWPNKVEEFMATLGADANDIQSALKGVQHVSWAGGGTLRRQNLVLLAFADDALCDGGERASCRLTRAVHAATRHTTEAHLILVADGFELDAATREAIEKILQDGGWRSFTSIEVPQLEGYSSAINRAMKVVPDNSVVAVLSTAALLLPASPAGTSTPATSTSGAEHVASDDPNGEGSGPESINVFVGYEQLKSTSTFLPSPLAPNQTDSSQRARSEAPGNFPPLDDDEYVKVGAEGARYNEFGNTHHRHNIGTRETLLVTAIPSRRTIGRQCPGSSGVPSAQGEGEHGNDSRRGNAEETEACSAMGTPPPPTQQQAPATSLSSAAALPLLVFDTETFSAMGELDEQFAFQGGVAEWISRAEFRSIGNGGGIVNDVGGSKCRIQTAGPCSDGVVRHVHQREWGARFVGSCPDSRVQPREHSTHSVRSPDVDRNINGFQEVAIQEQVLLHQGTDEGGNGRRRDSWISASSEEVIIDQWTRLPLAKLEALVQADADLFFLRLLLLPAPSDPGSHNESDLVDPCRAFHSEWMERAPDEEVMLALDRRKLFPVAVVVVVHDDISILRQSLEGVALVVEHILVVVSRRTWSGDDKDVSNALEVLNAMLEDVSSPTHGKLQVEVGSWATEPEQRNYGNDVIRADPRDFVRVVVMDTYEFWHPVELARALVQAAQHPEDSISRADKDTYWAGVRSLVSPEMPNDIWLVDPRNCVWLEHRLVWCDKEVDVDPVTVLYINRLTGVIRHLSYHEERQDLEQLQIRPVSGNLAIVDVNGYSDAAVPSWVTGATVFSPNGPSPVGVDAVWSKLLEAIPLRDHCPNPPCGKGKHIHSAWTDFGEEMSRVQGAVVVRRPDMVQDPGMLAPAKSLDFVKTLQSYFTIFKNSLLPTSTMITGRHLAKVQECQRFIDAVVDGDSTAARYLSTYYTFLEAPKRSIDGYESSPTLVSMADVFVNELGYVWNEKDLVVPKSCGAQLDGPRASMSLPTGAKSYEKVFVMAQRWGDAYFHFLTEALPRITLMLDILRNDLDIKIAVHGPDSLHFAQNTVYIYELLELLGVDRDRVVLLQEKTQIHAGLAILPSSIDCGIPDTQLTNMLRRHLLQALYPSMDGVPHPFRPVIILVVREKGRRLQNSDKVRDALSQEFPSYEVVEFRGTGSIVSQLQLFATASLIVAPHGAGLSNMIVSPLRTPVLEIGPVGCPPCFIHLAVKLHHIYARHPVSSDWRTPCASHYEPSIDEIFLLVRDLLEAKRQADAADTPQ